MNNYDKSILMGVLAGILISVFAVNVGVSIGRDVERNQWADTCSVRLEEVFKD